MSGIALLTTQGGAHARGLAHGRRFARESTAIRSGSATYLLSGAFRAYGALVGSTKPHGEAAPRFPTASPGDHMRLDSKSVAALHLGGKKDVIHFDDAMPGFGFRLRLGGGGRVLRTWIVQYRRAGASRRVLLGSAEVLSAEQARAQAKKVLAKVALGADPQAERTERRKADRVTFRSVVEE